MGTFIPKNDPTRLATDTTRPIIVNSMLINSSLFRMVSIFIATASSVVTIFPCNSESSFSVVMAAWLCASRMSSGSSLSSARKCGDAGCTKSSGWVTRRLRFIRAMSSSSSRTAPRDRMKPCTRASTVLTSSFSVRSRSRAGGAGPRLRCRPCSPRRSRIASSARWVTCAASWARSAVTHWRTESRMTSSKGMSIQFIMPMSSHSS
mmetsp:Transcript_36706/g.72157  ORF Transcript_36706/g.72157 Transcript_36706/m.72157 type:complete len:206 (+) Transcript_36706:413-1030(+)